MTNDNSTWSKATQDDIKSGKIIKRTINSFDYYFPKLVDRPTTKKIHRRMYFL